jgi:hypothetical protein
MRYGFWRGWPAAVLAAVLVVGTMRAQELGGGPVPPPGPPGPGTGGPATGPLPDGKWFPYGPVEIAVSTPPRPRTPVTNALRWLNIGCYSDLHHPGCMSLGAQAAYVFGSCHRFYHEPCMPWPSHTPPPVGLSQTGYGPAGSGQGGCDCER